MGCCVVLGESAGKRTCLQAASSGEQVEDEDDDGEDKEDVDEASADVKAEAKQPEDDKDDHNRPKHNEVFSDQSGITVMGAEAAWRYVW